MKSEEKDVREECMSTSFSSLFIFDLHIHIRRKGGVYVGPCMYKGEVMFYLFTSIAASAIFSHTYTYSSATICKIWLCTNLCYGYVLISLHASHFS